MPDLTNTIEVDGLRVGPNMVRNYWDRIKELEAALKPFADYFEGDLKDVGGGTAIAPEMTMQPFKDAKKLLSES